MILVDTSIWIKFFNEKNSPQAQKLKRLLEEDVELSLIDLILTEILQGIKNDRTFEETKRYLVKFPIFKARGLETYIHAAEIWRACRKKGKTIRKTIDCVIASIALENDLVLFHDDSDFDLIGECVGLKLMNQME